MTEMTARLTVTADAKQVVTESRSAGTAMQQLVDKTTGLTRANQNAKASAETFFPEIANVRREVDHLRMAYDPAYAAQKRYQTGVETLNRALDYGELNIHTHRTLLKRLGAEFDQASVSQTRFARTSEVTSRSMMRAGGGIQNAAFQLQDMIVQTSMGTPVLRAFGQQAPQLLGGFGAMGAVFGVVAALLPAIATGLFGVTTQGKSAAEMLDELGGSISSIESQTNELVELEDQYRIAIATRGLTQTEVSNTAIEGLTREMNLRRTMLEFERATARAAIERLRAETAAAQEAFVQQISAREGLTELNPNASFVEQQVLQRRLAEETLENIDNHRLLALELAAQNAELALQEAALLEIEAVLAGNVEQADALTLSLDLSSATDFGGTVSQIVTLAQTLGIATAEAQRLAEALPGYSAGGATGPDAALQAIRDEFTPYGGRRDDIVLRRTFTAPDTTSGRGGGGRQSDHERTISDIERRIARLSGSYERDIEAANEWREEALENLNQTAAGYEEYAADVATIYEEMLAEAYAEDLERRTDWRAGIERGLQDLLDNTRTWASTMDDVIVGSIERGEDAWVDWVTTGRASLSEVVNFAIEELARLAYQQSIQPALQGIFGLLTGGTGGGGGFLASLFGGGTTLPKSHSGSTMGRNTTSSTFTSLAANERLAVIENGQSIFTPRQLDNADAILSAVASAAARPQQVVVQGGGVVINDMRGTGRLKETERADGRTQIDIMDQVENEMAGRAQTPGSPLHQSLRLMGLSPNYGGGSA